ncbi:Adenylosuccinate lyase [Brachybacterium faecium DSM 4810]|uniref:Adenylosuccinate lyase n=1 Tax=Brachybacterium faecium (strain ATCC 43885 / DSM 4810 / JCM 11609 / LMG 19847 / NBRC 14762 / NCIMB 9860 / 6-10) TaxID=446465 RepID=C7MGA1_BRAFD|nr:adenylosuccinate lyase [Brachybacterium faecium]ACU86334.1 Adenylosuccinate lyase [Brachybacterium faecium DSM 4810]
MAHSFADISPQIALTPLDGRYRAQTAPLVDHLSEAALNRSRLIVETEWMIHLLDGEVIPGLRTLTADERALLRAIPEDFGADGIAEHAEIERETVHDVKAIEYYIKRRLAGTSLEPLAEVVHIYCTSEDVNNLAYALMVKGAVEQVWLPALREVIADLAALARDAAEVPMLSRTHGQPATPTTLGKEVAVFAHRLRRQERRISADEYLGKINGATGTYAAHAVSVPSADWQQVSRSFVEHLGLTWNPLTTQIESHDWQAEVYADIARAGRILHNLATDVWTYISLGYFRQRLSAQGGTGSSTMPHKVNPIRFENAEANLEISGALLDSLGSTLVTSRLQRDLTDSTTQRNIGPAIGHSLLAIANIRKGLAGLDVDADAMAADLEGNWEVLGEAVQSVMRTLGVQGVPGLDNPYERLKDLTRGHRVDGAGMREFIESLGLPEAERERLLALSPGTYVGYAAQLVDLLDDDRG